MARSNPTPKSHPPTRAFSSRLTERDALLQKICDLGGIASSPMTDKVTDLELTFLRRVVAFEEGPFTTHREWLRRRGFTFPSITEVAPDKLGAALWHLIRALVK